VNATANIPTNAGKYEAAVACARKPKSFGAYIRDDTCQDRSTA